MLGHTVSSHVRRSAAGVPRCRVSGKHATTLHRRCVGERLTRSAAESVDSYAVTQEDIAQFERVAAALMAKLQPSDNSDELDISDEQLLSEYDPLESMSVASTARALEERRAGGGAAGPSEPAALAMGAGFVPRAKRRRRIPDEFLPKVAIVGRPNVGKSALFNRIAGSAKAVVFDYPGVTRDRLYERAFWGDKDFVLIDTGGLMSDATRLPAEQQAAAAASISAEGLPQAIERQAAAGVAEADSVVLLVDGQAGLQAGDREILDWLRRTHPRKKVVLAVNKCESTSKADMQAAEFWELGLEPLPVSAISGTGTGEMLDALVRTLPPPRSLQEVDVDDTPLTVAIVGRPNVGKSSLVNAICGEERSIVCDMSGTTRDAVDTTITLDDGSKMVLVDTAGIRKRARVAESKDGAEQLSVDRAVRALGRAEVVVLVVDAAEGVTQQDYRLAELMASQGRAVVLVANKWDQVVRSDSKVTTESFAEQMRTLLRQVSWANVVCTTATRGTRVPEVLAAIRDAGAHHRKRVITATLNMVVRDAVAWKPPPSQRGSRKQGRVYYATQAGIKPPTFVFFVNETRLVSDDYRRYMERQLRDNIGFPGTPLRLFWRGKAGTQDAKHKIVQVGAKAKAARRAAGGKAAKAR